MLTLISLYFISIDEIHRLEVELEKSEIKYQKCMENLEKSEKTAHVSKQTGLSLEKYNQKLKNDIGKLKKEMEAKDQLVCRFLPMGLTKQCLFVAHKHEKTAVCL